jgi:hypothetical protein
MKEVSLKSLIFDLNLIVFKNNPSENQLVGSIGLECYNSKKALFFDIMPKIPFVMFTFAYIKSHKTFRKYIIMISLDNF